MCSSMPICAMVQRTTGGGRQGEGEGCSEAGAGSHVKLKANLQGIVARSRRAQGGML